MDGNQAIAQAQSALRLTKLHGGSCSGLTHNERGVWRYRKYGWTVLLWDSGKLIECRDDWGMGR